MASTCAPVSLATIYFFDWAKFIFVISAHFEKKKKTIFIWHLNPPLMDNNVMINRMTQKHMFYVCLRESRNILIFIFFINMLNILAAQYKRTTSAL